MKQNTPLAEWLAKKQMSSREFSKLIGISQNSIVRIRRRVGASLLTGLMIEKFTNGEVKASDVMPEKHQAQLQQVKSYED